MSEATVTIREPQDMVRFLEHPVDPERVVFQVMMTIQHAIVNGRPDKLYQASLVENVSVLTPVIIAHAICHLAKWCVERPLLSGKRPGYFPVLRTTSWQMESLWHELSSRLMDYKVPDGMAFERLKKQLDKEGVLFTVTPINRELLQ